MAINETVPFNFDETYDAIKQKFQDLGYDSLYEGSNTAQLITAMSYLTSMLNANTAANINETILTLATKRDNIVQDARILGYEVQHIGSYKYDLTLEFTAGNHSITKYSKFVGGAYNYYYMGDTLELVNVPDGYTETIEIVQGDLKTFTEFPTLLRITTTNILNENNEEIPQYYIDIPFVDVEEDGIECFLTYYDENGNLHEAEQWKKSDQFMIDKDSVLNQEFIRLDNIKMKMPRIYFKLSGVGVGLRLGTIVEMNVLVSAGTAGELLDIPSTTIANCTPLSYSLNIQGSDEEDSQSIKDNAPLFHNSANRAVTKSDYIAICTRQQTVQEVEVWSGDDEHPKVPGNVWFSFRPSTLTRTFTNDEFKLNFNLDTPEDLVNWYLEDSEFRNSEKSGVWDTVDLYKIPTLVFNNEHPLYMDFDFGISIMKYNIKTSKADIHQAIFDVINNYFLGNDEHDKIEQFDIEYFHSSLEKRIDTDLTDITGFNNTLTNKIMLNSKTLIQNKTAADNYKIKIPLGIPFEKYFDENGNLIPTNLPSIDTVDFVTGIDIATDWSGLTGSEKDLDVIEVPIKDGTTVIGKYSLFNTERRDILVELYVKDTNATDEYAVSTLTKAEFDVTKYLDVQYPSPNFPVIKNVIPRLRSVIFN